MHRMTLSTTEQIADFYDCWPTTFPEETIEQGKERLEQDHLSNHGERQQAAHAVPESISENGCGEPETGGDGRKMQPVLELWLSPPKAKAGMASASASPPVTTPVIMFQSSALTS